MNREILFRGKRKNHIESHIYRSEYKNGDWVYGLITKCHPKEFWDKLNDEMTDVYGVSGIEIDRNTVGQYTGLRDKNGKKIFEGDIVKLVYNGNTNVYQVVYDTSELDFKGTNGKEKYENNFQYLVCCEEIDVIGNIYDNPELREAYND